jgi:hypothetical protein
LFGIYHIYRSDYHFICLQNVFKSRLFSCVVVEFETQWNMLLFWHKTKL